ncbi:hypothetical protein OsccyDRAFT_1564 [Leptolyngbyaceae cyanobacterium JSC-12]|nr:hypothetical protein OsccyDRAFT_1564 [Leptolyngbyaceae cyanobacterium JSC-12]
MVSLRKNYGFGGGQGLYPFLDPLTNPLVVSIEQEEYTGGLFHAYPLPIPTKVENRLKGCSDFLRTG